MKSVRGSLKSLSAKLTPTSILIDDESEEEFAQSNVPRDFLAQLILNHQNLCLELPAFTEILKPDICLNDAVIDLYLSRILQPIADMRQENIVFLSTQIYELLKRGDSDYQSIEGYFSKYNIDCIETFVMICNTPGHWVTVIIKIDPYTNKDLDTRSAQFLYYDSMENSIKPENFTVNEITKLFMHVFGNSLVWNYKCLEQKMQTTNGKDCGVWALMYAESVCKGYRNANDIPFPDVTSERCRIQGELNKLYDLQYFLKSFSHEGIIYKKPNPESVRCMPDPVSYGMYIIFFLLYTQLNIC